MLILNPFASLPDPPAHPHPVDARCSVIPRAIDKFILPHVVEAARTGEDRHIVLVAHGIFNSELVGALLRRRTNDRSLAKNEARTGPMTNTGA